MQNMKKILLLAAAVLLLASCKETAILKPNCSGAAFDLLWVVDDNVYNSAAGDSMRMYLEGPVPFLPQPEPQFKISRFEWKLYDNLLRTTRNILFVTVDPTRFTQAKVKFAKDQWANNQAICIINSPDLKSIEELMPKCGDRIVDYFVKAERERMKNYYIANISHEVNQRIYDTFDCQLALPTSMKRIKRGENFMWISNGSVEANQNIVIYTVPYYSKEQLTPEAILARRDSVMKANIPGEVKGSYMATELNHMYPETRAINFNDEWAAETRGLWKVKEGGAMGGPFVSLTTVDMLNKRVLTVEGFVFAPSREKRNLLRQMDAMVYSLITPQRVQVTVTNCEENNDTENGTED